MNETNFKDLLTLLDAFSKACDLPESIPEMQTWESRKSRARERAMMALEVTFTPDQLRSLYDLTAEMLAYDLADEKERDGP